MCSYTISDKTEIVRFNEAKKNKFNVAIQQFRKFIKIVFCLSAAKISFRIFF